MDIDAAIVREIDDFLHDPYDKEEAIEKLSVWNKIWFAMEHPSYSLAAKIWTFVYFLVVFTTVLLFSVETVARFREYTDVFLHNALANNESAVDVFLSMDPLNQLIVTQPEPWLRIPQLVMFAFFVIEFVVRLATCPDKMEFLRHKRTWCDVVLLTTAGVYYVVELAVLQERVSFSSAEAHSILFFYAFSMIRSFRIIYLAKHSDELKILILSAKSSVKELLLLLICVVTFVTMFGSFAYVTEAVSNDHTFHSIPQGMWWAIVTMTTVGYGDVAPVGVYGQLLGALCTLSGIIVLALPIAVVASKFTSYHDNLTARQQMRVRMTFINDKAQLHNSDISDDPRSTENEAQTGMSQRKSFTYTDVLASTLRDERQGQSRHPRRPGKHYGWPAPRKIGISGELHLPENLCSAVAARELEFWEISTTLIHECCWRKFENHHSDAAIVREIDDFLHDPYDKEEAIEKLSMWNKIWFAMEHPSYSLAAKLVMFAFFVIEFVVRLITCPNKMEFLRHKRTWCDVILLTTAGVYYVVELAVLQERVEFSPAESHSILFFYAFSMIRSFRVIYLTKHFDSLKIILLSAKSSVKELILLVICVLAFVTLFGSFAYVTETVTSDYSFSSIPEGMWWAIVTMTTVGYGDVVPVGVYGRLVGALCTLSGIVVLALPFAIVASKFYGFHDNLSPRHQMCTRMDFLRHNPHFCNRVKDASKVIAAGERDGETEDDVGRESKDTSSKRTDRADKKTTGLSTTDIEQDRPRQEIPDAPKEKITREVSL
nr:hypothetical protein BaRGS_032025 [Batillaria attramentaria]